MRQMDTALAQTYDSLASSFAGILMQLQAVAGLTLENGATGKKCLRNAEELARQGLRQVRELVQTTVLDDGGSEGLFAAVETLVERTTMESATQVPFEAKVSSRPITRLAAETLKHILKESLSNTQRHAHAKRIEVMLCFEDDRVVLEISDDGNGFVPDEASERGFGLVGMRARVDRLGGGLWLRSSPGKGTKIRAALPNPYADE